MGKGISVIVCCFNSAAILPDTIRYLANQKVDNSIKWEIVIVNNASTDNTKETALKELSKFNDAPFSYIIIDQQIQGLSHARKLGVENSCFDYIIFCDDDNCLHNDYIEKAFTLIDSDEKIGIIGGRGFCKSNIEFPLWWEEYKADYAVGEQANCDGELIGYNYIWGAGLITRKDLFLKAFSEKFPPLLTGRNGVILSAGEDTEYNIRARLLGFKTFYFQSLMYTHYIKEERLTIIYRNKLKEGFQDVWKIIIEYENQIKYESYSLRQKRLESFRIIKRIIINILFRDRKNSQDQFDSFYRITKIPIGHVRNEIKIITDFVASTKKFKT